MRTIDEIRHANLLRIIEREGGKIQAVADKLGKAHAQISQLKNRNSHSKSTSKRTIGDAMARQIEHAYELERGWMDNIDQPFPDQAYVSPVTGYKVESPEDLKRREAEQRKALISVVRDNIERNSGLYASERLAHYRSAIDELLQDDAGAANIRGPKQ